MRLRDLPIRYKLLLSYSLLFVAILTAGGTAAYLYVRAQIEESIEDELRVSSEGILSMVQISVDLSIRNSLRADAESARDVVEHLHAESLAGTLSEAEARRRAERFLLSQQIASTGYIYCINSQGTAVVHPRPAVVGNNYREFDFIRKQISRREGYVEYDWKNPGETRARPKALYMVYFKPWDWIISASAYRSEFIELVKVEDFRQTILNTRFGDTGYPYIIDGRGRVVIHPVLSGDFYREEDAEGRAFVREMIDRANGTIFYTWRGPGESEARRRLAVFRHLPEFDWIVVSTSYADEFYAPLERLRYLFLATLGVALVLIVLISWKLSSHIATPLRRLTGHFQTGADGDLSSRVEADSNDEVGRLGRCFNSFMAKLQLYRDSLESEIRERKRAESEREQLEQQVRQKMKMEAIGQLAGGVAHDFNNILTAIRGNAELLKMDVDRGGDEAEMLDEIMRASRRAADLTAQLLAFGRRGKMQVTQLDLHDAIRETVRLLEHSIDKKIELQLDLQAERSVIEGDATQIHNALLNLALNARDAMPEGGSLRFATRNVPVEESDVTDSRGRRPEYIVEVSVADTGIGIEPELQDRIFEPFFTTKGVGEGSGLGLAGVYGAMENHNGRVLVESTPGQGTTFSLLLPVFAAPDASQIEPDQAASGGVHGTGTILVVEDDDVVRTYVTRMLKTFGYEVIAASDGAEGLDCFRTRHRQIDAVILDVTMPHMDGTTALTRMHEIDPSTPIILASGYRQGRGSPDLVEAGAAGFVPKPYTAETLTRELDRVLHDRRGASRATTQDG